MDSVQDRRSRPRVEVNLEMKCEWDGGTTACNITNISMTGVLLKSSELHDPGDRLRMFFRLPGVSEEIDVMGHVAWGGAIEGESLGNYRIGVLFDDLNPRQKDLVEAYIQSIMNG